MVARNELPWENIPQKKYLNPKRRGDIPVPHAALQVGGKNAPSPLFVFESSGLRMGAKWLPIARIRNKAAQGRNRLRG